MPVQTRRGSGLRTCLFVLYLLQMFPFRLLLIVSISPSYSREEFLKLASAPMPNLPSQAIRKISQHGLAIHFSPSVPSTTLNATLSYISPIKFNMNKLVGGLLICRSEVGNASLIYNIILDNNLNYLCLTETWFNPSSVPVLDELFQPG